jgi:hypothetical protein
MTSGSSRAPRIPLAFGLAAALLLPVFTAREEASGSIPGGVTSRFERTTTRDGTTEVAKGVLYLSATGRLGLRVEEPVSQIMSCTDSLMTIVYPDEKRAFVVRHVGIFSPDMVFPSIAYRYVAQGLEDAGYELVSYDTIDDTTTFVWRHPESEDNRWLPTRVEAKLVGDLSTSMSSFDEKGSLFSRITFASYREVGGLTVPMQVKRTRVTGAARTSETFILTDPIWMDALPDSVLEPAIDDDYEILRYDFRSGQ